MSRIYTRVRRVADWPGWCSPCSSEDRPLVLTRSGPGGLRAWLAGHGDDDRLLLLTCRVCGGWQFVPAREEEDPEIVLVEDVEEQVRAAVAAIVLPAPRAEVPAPAAVASPAAEAPAVVVPEPRRPVARIVTVPGSVTTPAFSPEAVAAAARVLAAARAEFPPALPRPRKRPQPAPAAVPALPAALRLPTVARQVVLAPAS